MSDEVKERPRGDLIAACVWGDPSAYADETFARRYSLGAEALGYEFQVSDEEVAIDLALRVLDEVASLCASGRVDDALDHLLRAVDAWLDAGLPRRCDLLCELMRLDRVDDAVPLALLGATLERKSLLPHREPLVARLETHLRQRHAAREVDAMLWGLRGPSLSSRTA
jgi:hypothetical protein